MPPRLHFYEKLKLHLTTTGVGCLRWLTHACVTVHAATPSHFYTNELFKISFVQADRQSFIETSISKKKSNFKYLRKFGDLAKLKLT